MKRFFKRLIPLCLLLPAAAGSLSAHEVREAQPVPPAVREDLILSFTGDMMAHIINYAMPDYSMIYRDVEDIMLGDSLTFSNVEFPVNPEIPQASYPVFNIHPEYVEAAVRAGVDVLSIANNHTADQGTAGLKATVGAMQALCVKFKKEGRSIRFSGAKTNPRTEFKPVTIYKNGWKIGYLSVSQFSNVTPRPGYMMLVNFNNKDDSAAFIDMIAEESGNYDLFILAYHGGVEYRTSPLRRKTEFFEKLAEAGVDIIWGHHPHVVQPIERIKTSRGETVVMNSLGNFISGQGRINDPALPEEEWSYTGDSAIVQLEIRDEDGRPGFADLRAIPIANIMTTNREVVITPLEELTHQPVPEPWMNFFLERYILMHDYFNRNIRSYELPSSRD